MKLTDIMMPKEKEMNEKELKLMIAGQCMAGILASSNEWNNQASSEDLAKFGWSVATKLIALSKEEEEK